MSFPDKQTVNKRPDGKFSEGNKLGRRFQPGQSGNPRGRPRSITLSEAYRKELAKVDPTDPDGRTYAEVLAEKMREKACAGDVVALRELADRTEGKAKQTVQLSMETRERLERAVEGMMEETGCTREEAINTLALLRPEVSQLSN